jgi:hypothetical protein
MIDENIDRIVELDIDDDIFENELDETGVEIVSIVDSPAIEQDFLYFNKEDEVELRKNPDCPDGFEHRMPDGSYMCGKNHGGSYQLESYSDYPKAARENACRAIIWSDEEGWGDCGEATGKKRASQLCMGQNISRDTIARMASFKRHQQHKDVPYDEGCGGLMWDAWGGDEGIAWAQRKLDQIYNEELSECKLSEELILSDEAQKLILDFANDDDNGMYIGIEDIYLDFTKTSFGVGEVVQTIRGLDILQRLVVKKDEPAETYWRYSGRPAQREFCKAMMSLANRGKIFSEEELDKMYSLNPAFAERGKSQYDKMAWKGGVSCVHYFQKLQVFKGQNGNKVVILTNDAANERERNAMKSNNQNVPGPLGSVRNNASINKSFDFSLDEEERIVLGPLMIPNKLILRREADGSPFHIFFSRKTIKKMAEKFFRKNNQNNTDINHDEDITNKNTLIESWISDSMTRDKSYHYGFSLPPGTWFVSYKINDDDTWEKIKSGELNGFSLAGGFIQKMKVAKADETLNSIKDILNQVK